jgi:PAS domain S-box-containing protein/TyrR family helix-turn-helix protein
MKVRDFLCSSRIQFFKVNDTVKDACAVFNDLKIDASVVVDDNGTLVGLFTKNHVFKAIKKGIPLDTPIGELMTRNVMSGHPDDNVEDRFYFKHGYLPVVENGKAVGVISIPDFVKTYHDSYKVARNFVDAIVNSSSNLLISVGQDGRIILVNRMAEERLDMSESEFIGKYYSDVFPDLSLKDVMKSGIIPPMQKVMLKGRPFINSRYPVWLEGKIIGAVSAFQDVEALDLILNELGTVKELNRDLDAIIESSSDGIFVCDGNANVLRINKAYDVISELDTTGFYGRNMRDLVADGTYSKSVTLLVIEKKETVSIIQKTSSGKSLLATGKPVFDEKGNIFRVVTSVRDITDLHRIQQTLEETQKMTEEFRKELDSLRIKSVKNIDGMIIGSEKMNALVDMAIRLAKVDSTIMITGESGTGKDLVAGIIHKYSLRENKPFIKVNCGAIPANLLESELFGYEDGAFTGARKGGKPGYFEMADRGTLFLDEIGELPYELQAKLLRVLQHKEFNRVGGQKFRQVDVRILTATNRDLLEMVTEKKFREDLYYRLNVVPLNIPSLRERKEDIPFITAYYLKLFNDSYNMTKRFSTEVMDAFEKYSWPGNIRELRNLVERLVVMCPDNVITPADLPSNICTEARCEDSVTGGGIRVIEVMPLKDAIENVEKQLIARAYEKFASTREMAKHLKISAPSIVRRAAKYGITKNGLFQK